MIIQFQYRIGKVICFLNKMLNNLRSQIRAAYKLFVKSREPTTAAIDGRSLEQVE